MSKTIPVHIDIDLTVSEVDESITSQEMVNRFIDAIRDKLFHLNNNPDFGWITTESVQERKHIGCSWNCCEEDFSEIHGYDLSLLSRQEIDNMIEEVDIIMSENEYVAECFHDTVREVAADHNLNKLSD